MSPPTLSAVRVAGQLTAAFLLDFVEIGRGDRTLVDSVLMVAMVQANVAPVTREPDLQRAYGGYDDGVPDAMRRPTSISSLANSLRLPYETVRRRVTLLQQRGLCVVTPAGAYVPQEVLTLPEHMTGVFRTYERLRQFYYQLDDLGLVRAEPPPADLEPLEPLAQVRAIMRLLGDYVLRSVDAVTSVAPDMVSGLILLGVLRANTDQSTGPEASSLDGLIPDAARRPIPAASLAARLRLPPETVRRHAAKLVAAGLCEKTSGGLVLPGEVLAQPAILGLIADNYADLNRLFAALGQLGVLAAWDAARPATTPAHAGSR